MSSVALTTPLTDHLASLKLIDARSLRGETTRLRILEAAKNTFTRLGYELTTVDDIAKEAGISRPGFYVYFPTRFSAAEALAEYVGVFILKDFDALAALGPHPAQEDLAIWVLRRFAVMIEQHEYMRIFRHVVAVEPSFAARTRARYAEAFYRLAPVYPAFARAADAPDGEDAVRAHMLLSQLDQLSMDLIAGWRADPETIAAIFAGELARFLNS
ncbi:putative TetR family transcriptional regulator [Caenibius tardaugens NBRC 16725]|uniref:Putative TetR family transcriptional regulator n=1 Tax=Caenibius tardaugens NBRC 16725 TaxID=1219035 RepID=U3A3U5_9SPHN|nr:TetR/AcrR family transcriptional regulator [Caenibius tardaugens]GAD49423.1 putative TetR family transcriptional regulator [Caenibius tardaugens NBRC 16725]